LRSVAGTPLASTGVPHDAQKRASAARAAPHAGQASSKAVPHAEQNLAPGALPAPQDAHVFTPEV